MTELLFAPQKSGRSSEKAVLRGKYHAYRNLGLLALCREIIVCFVPDISISTFGAVLAETVSGTFKTSRAIVNNSCNHAIT